MSTADDNDMPSYLTCEQIRQLGGDPDELVRLGVEPVTGHDGVACWPRWQVEEWLDGRKR